MIPSFPYPAGAEAGDGRDESNKSLAERLEDARNGQTAADAEAKAADVRSKHLSKQLADARKAAAAKEKEGGQLAKDLAKAQAAVAEGQAKLQVRCWGRPASECGRMKRAGMTAVPARACPQVCGLQCVFGWECCLCRAAAINSTSDCGTSEQHPPPPLRWHLPSTRLSMHGSQCSTHLTFLDNAGAAV